MMYYIYKVKHNGTKIKDKFIDLEFCFKQCAVNFIFIFAFRVKTLIAMRFLFEQV